MKTVESETLPCASVSALEETVSGAMLRAGEAWAVADERGGIDVLSARGDSAVARVLSDMRAKEGWGKEGKVDGGRIFLKNATFSGPSSTCAET